MSGKLKKILLLMICIMLIICGCGKKTKEDVINELKNNINNVKSYKVIGNMEISNDEETFTYSIESYYLKDNYYKVKLVNQTNNHEQIILRNGQDVYVITPSLNKSFKFQSDWPDNSSQAYMLKSIIKDIDNDKNSEVESIENGYIIKTNVNYPNNNELKYQKIYLNDKKQIEKVEVYDGNDIVKIKVNFDNIDLNSKIKESDFKIDEYIKEEPTEEENKVSNTNCEEEKCSEKNEEKETSNIENIIYPLYIPSNTYLTSSEKVSTNNGNRVILTFGGEKNFVLIEEATLKNTNMEIVPVYGEPLMLSETLGALSSNSLTWDVGNVSYYLASTELDPSEMISIANSLGNNILVAKTK